MDSVYSLSYYRVYALDSCYSVTHSLPTVHYKHQQAYHGSTQSMGMAQNHHKILVPIPAEHPL